MYHFNRFILSIGGVIWGAIVLLSCNHPHATQMDEPTIHSLEADIHQSNDEGVTDLHVAVRKGDTAAVNALLSQVPETHRLTLIQQRSNHGETALHDAANNGHEDVVNTLLSYITEAERLALIRQGDENLRTTLHIASINGHEAVVSTLLSHI